MKQAIEQEISEYQDKQTPVHPGHLEISYYSFRTKKTHNIDVSTFLEFYLLNEYASFEVNLNTSKIIANFKNENTNLEIESSLALVYSIVALHVLLQPKPKPYLDEKANRFKLPSLKSEKNILDNLALSSCIGLAELVASESYFHYYKNLSENEKKHNWLFGEAAGFNELELSKTIRGNTAGCGGGAAGCWGGIYLVILELFIFFKISIYSVLHFFLIVKMPFLNLSLENFLKNKIPYILD